MRRTDLFKNILKALLPFLLLSCSPETDKLQSADFNPPIIEGFITEIGTEIPLENIPIDLYGPFYGGANVVRTDSNGFYRFDLGADANARDYYIDFFGNSTHYNWNGRHYATESGYNRIDGKLYPKGWIKLHISNLPDWSVGDIFNFIHYSPYTFYHKIDTVITLQFRANEARIFRYSIESNGITTFFADTIFPIGHDTISHEIKF